MGFINFIYLQTMGMAVMLDVVISYVQSLQNQIEVPIALLLLNQIMINFSYTQVISTY